MDQGLLIVALAIVTHAFIGRLQTPPAVINVLAWVFTVLALLLLLIALARRVIL